MGNKKEDLKKNNDRPTVADIDEIAIAVPSEVMEATDIATVVGEVIAVDPIPVVIPTKFKVANCSKLNIRKSADKNAPVLFIIPVGTILEVDFHENDDWAHVRTSDGKEGYVMRAFIEEVI